MSGLLIFVAGASEDGPVPVEVDPMATVGDVLRELEKPGGVLMVGGKRLHKAEQLCDVGVCSESVLTLEVNPLVIAESFVYPKEAGGTGAFAHLCSHTSVCYTDAVLRPPAIGVGCVNFIVSNPSGSRTLAFVEEGASTTNSLWQAVVSHKTRGLIWNMLSCSLAMNDGSRDPRNVPLTIKKAKGQVTAAMSVNAATGETKLFMGPDEVAQCPEEHWEFIRDICSVGPLRFAAGSGGEQRVEISAPPKEF
eukprot:TRINITY_DN36370_c0_g1_i1.p1 TRINITY_DN36370_c0_g1~~TRINITY_DN36370_c0_g1_i1.p1  ORF type:complete len:250 (+),score=55.27 TRINITY_DN36370_c0_g1_i1:60-809(+)